GRLRSAMNTCAPSRRQLWAVAQPIPRAPPTMTTTLSANLSMFCPPEHQTFQPPARPFADERPSCAIIGTGRLRALGAGHDPVHALHHEEIRRGRGLADLHRLLVGPRVVPRHSLLFVLEPDDEEALRLPIALQRSHLAPAHEILDFAVAP